MAKRLSYEEAVAELNDATSREEIFEVLERCPMSTLEELVEEQKLHVRHQARDKKSDYVCRIYHPIVDSKKEEATQATEPAMSKATTVEVVEDEYEVMRQ